MKYVTIASTFSGNKGAASMLEASIQTITVRDKDAYFDVLTVYPEEDVQFNTFSNVRLLNAKPLYLGLVINPLALVYGIFPPLRPLLRKNPQIKSIADADVYLDQGGITFVDGRTKFLIYNVATLLPAIFMRTKIVKCSQAMGPSSGINRFVSRLILPRVDTICARGDITRKYLKSLNLSNVIDSTDYAFLLEVTEDEIKKSEQLLRTYKFENNRGKTIAVMPSEVVRKKAEAGGQDYVKFNQDFINYLLKKGHQVVLIAYSARGGKDSRHNNDLPVCRDIAAGMANDKFILIDEELSAQQLRHIIEKVDIAVTSRFHAMIAALTVEVPPLVVGWSHKYAEIMDMFGLKELALDSKKLDQKRLRQAFEVTLKNQAKSKVAIRKYLPEVKHSAEKQVNAILGSGR